MLPGNNTPILVTGAAGLAGSAVCERLRESGHTCVIPVTRAMADLTDRKKTMDFFMACKPEKVVHCAATVYGLGGNMRHQAKSILTNTQINMNVIEASIAADVHKFVAMGTNAVYPHGAKLPYREKNIFDGRPHHGESGYAHAKRHMLAMLEAYRETHPMKYAYVVSGNLYGPRDKFDIHDGHVIPSMIAKFADASKTGGTVHLWGDGTPKRDFLFSRDLAAIIGMILDGSTEGAINIGSGVMHSIGETARMLAEISGVEGDRVFFDPDRPNGRMATPSDLRRLDYLGFSPTFSLRIGLKLTWDWYFQSGQWRHDFDARNPVR